MKRKCPPGCTCKIHTNSGSVPCPPDCACWKHSEEHRQKLSVALSGRKMPSPQTCSTCGLSWTGFRGAYLLKTHPCLETCSPTMNQFLNWLGVVQEDQCLVPTNHVKRAHGSQMHWMLPHSAVRILGEQYAHRAVLVLSLERPIKEGLLAAHECGFQYENDRCVNPKHIFERTKQENALWVPPEVRSERQRRASQKRVRNEKGRFT
jgi:hypothetical protein